MSGAGRVRGLSRLVLLDTALQDIPLKQRLIVSPAEAAKRPVYHESIVKKLDEMQVKGCRFVRLDEG